MSSINFAELALDPDILQAIEQAGYSVPTPIQVHAVPAMLGGSDVHLQAQTGTGKTAAFVLPTVQRMTAAPGRIEALVLTPTRELAQQVSEEFVRMGAPRGLHATAIYGGTSFEKQYKALETAQIVVATPGRLLDLHRRGRVDLRHVRFFGLDEADEMLSMGFDRDVLEIAGLLPTARQSFLCSATFNDPILRIAASITRNPVTINTSSDAIGARSIRHEYFRVPDGTRSEALLRIIAQTAVAGAIVFCNTRAASFRVNELLRADGRNADVLNGELSQSEREAALARMRAGEVDFLVATDVAARGIDISGLPAVINYDMPDAAEVYVHRTGRTGRAGQAGIAYSIVCPGDITVFHALQKTYKLQLDPARLATGDEIRTIRADRLIDTLLGDIDAAGTLRYAGFLPLADRLRSHPDGVRIIAKLIATYAGVSPSAAPHAQAAAAPSAATAAPAPTPVAPVAEPAPATSDESSSAANGDASASVAAEPETAPPAGRRERRPRGERPAKTGATPETQVAAAEPTATPTAEIVAPAAPATTLIDVARAAATSAFEWLRQNTQQRNIGRFFHVDDIAAALGIEPAQVIAEADAHELIERARNGDPMWRLRRPALAELFGPPPGRPASPPATAPARQQPANEAPVHKTAEAPDRRDATAAAPGTRAGRDSGTAARVPPGFVVMRVNVGRDLVSDPRELVRHLVELSGFDRDDVGKLDLADDFSLLPVRKEYSADFVAALQQESLKGRRLQIVPHAP